MIERISKLNLILQDHETDVRCMHDHFAGAIVHFYDILVCFGVYKVFNLFLDVAQKKIFGSKKRGKKTKWRVNKITTMH